METLRWPIRNTNKQKSVPLVEAICFFAHPKMCTYERRKRKKWTLIMYIVQFIIFFYSANSRRRCCRHSDTKIVCFSEKEGKNISFSLVVSQ